MNSAANHLWLACAVDGKLVPTDPCSLSMPSGLESGDQLVEMLAGSARVLRDAGAERVVILDPETNAQMSFKTARSRVTGETLLALAAAQSNIPCERASRAQVRSVLGLSRSGRLSSLVQTVVVTPLSPYWRDKRDLAALAALSVTGAVDAEG